MSNATTRWALTVLDCSRRPPEARRRTVHVLTHCNAGWIATVDFGTALSPIYQAYDAGVDLHVWVDETRPRNQGGADRLGAGGARRRRTP